ncbi:MAG: choline-sulfatase [Roseibacillus sp.]|mgnify:CR=1 FL=1|jgi:choline-sulfatase|nr:choline-sulfatase [Roseibacillus sp.]MBP36045.1 choline-sulfatase [Roseibacillus sp.]MCP4729917.1 sulfatase-like hydrolase/transferase [Roseibacillus sp.]MDP7308247.1 sulfatase-like hydrolase/transferase [Roseibacillus sp.]HJM62217.1 sulfatase-like hydrolase/transferase [Roseibacillus sp.]|tara:strand:- start:25718 stop:27139 length:1422 start_codon:yes stop_codon:yes gene_type:complete
MKRLTLFLSACAFLLLPVVGAAKPNILFIFADDMTYDAIAALGHEEIETPHLDRLVKGGTTFTHAYNSGSWSGAVCVASRHMLMTGRQLWNAHKVANRKGMAEYQAQKKCWPQLLESAGYRTYMSGKWHVQVDAGKVFNVARHVRPGMPRSVKKAYNRPLEGKPDPWDPTDKSIGGFWEGGKHWSEVQADDAVGFLQEAGGSQQPFFIYLAFNAPHDPRQAPQEYLDRYPADRIAIPKNFLPRYPFCDQIGNPHKLRDENLAPMPRTRHSVQVHRREYYAIITHMDAQIGRVLDELKKSGKEKNTYIVFTADHGLAVGKHGLFGKQNMYDHSVRVPFVVVGPGVAAGAANNAPIYLQDVIPSSLDWAGAKTPDYVQFRSIQPHLDGKGKKRDYVYGAYLGVQRSITEGGYKLIYYPRAGNTLRLYKVSEDPHEVNDLIKSGGAATEAVVTRLWNRLQAVQGEFGDSLTLVRSP